MQSRRYLDVAEEILRSVALGTLRPGDRLPHERDLAQRCGVSRTTVREALLALELSGVVEIRPGAGCFMAGVSSKPGPLATLPPDSQPRQLLDVRLLLEPVAARQCAAGIRREDLARLTSLVNDAVSESATGSPATLDRYLSLNLSFHREIARSCGNPVLAELTIALIDAENHPLWLVVDNIVVRDPSVRNNQLDEHRAILDAIARRDEEAAASAMAAHLDALGTRVFGPGAPKPKVARARPRHAS
jgi:DNA-binding FadR family transcriptional regulator